MNSLVQKGVLGGSYFFIEPYAVPDRQVNRFVVAVPNAALYVGNRVAHHRSPWQILSARIALNEAVVRCLAQAVGISGVDVDGRSAGSVEEFHHVRFSPSSAERFVFEYEHLIRIHLRGGNEKPFSLPDETVVFPLVAVFGFHAQAFLCLNDNRGLETFLGDLDRGRRAVDVCHKPVALVVSAQEFRFDLASRFACAVGHLCQEEQVAILRSDVNHRKFHAIAKDLKVEELALVIVAHIEPEVSAADESIFREADF